MAKQISEKILNEIIEIVQQFPQGVSLKDILNAVSVPKRSVQRYLALLVTKGLIQGTGTTRGRQYNILSTMGKDTPFLIKEEQSTYKSIGMLIPLSAIALSIQENVRQPIQARKPVSYKREFLDSYRPNETFYLPEITRKHLLKIGKANNGERQAGTYARQILNRLLIDLSWNSSRLEGNTYSLLETERLLELGETPEGKDSKEAQMILNHKSAIEFMVDSADFLNFNHFTILNLHAILADNLLQDQNACGRLRKHAVGIAKSVYRPISVPQLIEEYFQQILDTAAEIKDPFEQSFFVMVHLPYLQPFLDVNKRVSRLAANIPFIRENLCPLSFVDVPEQVYVSGLLGVYELNRIELLREVFVWAYERSSSLYSVTQQELGEPDLFRLRNRNLIIETIGEVIRGRMDKASAIAKIRKIAYEAIPFQEQAKFVEVIETELRSLHKGNIGRFKIRPSEYDLWLETWS